MKKEELLALGLTEEQVAEVFKLNGKDIAAEQRKTERAEAERDGFKEQLETAQTTLKQFEGVDVKELQGKITELTGNIETMQTKHQQELADRDFIDSLKSDIAAMGGRSDKAIMAMLDIDTLKASKNQKADIKAALEACQKDNAYLFGAGEPINNPVGATGGAGNSAPSGLDAMRAAFGLPPAKAN